MVWRSFCEEAILERRDKQERISLYASRINHCSWWRQEAPNKNLFKCYCSNETTNLLKILAVTKPFDLDFPWCSVFRVEVTPYFLHWVNNVLHHAVVHADYTVLITGTRNASSEDPKKYLLTPYRKTNEGHSTHVQPGDSVTQWLYGTCSRSMDKQFSQKLPLIPEQLHQNCLTPP